MQALLFSLVFGLTPVLLVGSVPGYDLPVGKLCSAGQANARDVVCEDTVGVANHRAAKGRMCSPSPTHVVAMTAVLRSWWTPCAIGQAELVVAEDEIAPKDPGGPVATEVNDEVDETAVLSTDSSKRALAMVPRSKNAWPWGGSIGRNATQIGFFAGTSATLQARNIRMQV